MEAVKSDKRVVDYDSTYGGTVLFKAIEERHWKAALSRIAHSPQDVSSWVHRIGSSATACYRFKMLPLHFACKRKPPSMIVSALVAAHIPAVSMTCDGNLPIHEALDFGASVDVIKILISTHPAGLHQKNRLGLLPIDIFKEHSLLWNETQREKIKRLLENGVDDDDLEESQHNALGGGTSLDLDTTNKEESRSLETTLQEEGWRQGGLIIVVVGASGDLAKKKTYPSILNLFNDHLLPSDTVIWGYARSAMTLDVFRDKLRPYLEKAGDYSPDVIDSFLSMCFYCNGKAYGDLDAWESLAKDMRSHEVKYPKTLEHNRLFYFAIPPNVFAETGLAIKQKCMADKGWSRMIIEKPFGRDLATCEELLDILAKSFDESQLYRIDHYLGKEMVQNLLVLRFGNLWFDRIWNRDNIQCVMLTFKEPFGTDGRGGYFDKFGIIRDIIQNHLLQVMTLMAMEPPTKADGPESGDYIRDAKVHVLKAVPSVTIDDCFLGQYEGYADDPTIENKDTNTPTFAMVRLFINTPRWSGVPFILKAGKALDERKAEMRIQFKDAPGASFMFNQPNLPRNELVMRLQPHEAIYMKTNVKSPGFNSEPVQSELEVNYDTQFFVRTGKNAEKTSNPDAYTRLILDVLRGKSAAFVRADELRRSWEIFTPLLHKIERENILPLKYKFGSRGPAEMDNFLFKKSGYKRNSDYATSYIKKLEKSKL